MKKCVDLLNTKEYSLLIDTTFNNNDLPNVNPKYVVQKICIPTPPPLSYPLPQTPWNFRNFQLRWVPSGKNICVKNVVALCYYAKDDFFFQR